jgi:hypothetical protein
MNLPAVIRCEILAPRAAEAAALGAIARTCARDVGQPLTIKIAPLNAPVREAVLTLHLPAELAASQHQVWCLACQLACFCPQARVSVLVLGADQFGTSRKRRSAA